MFESELTTLEETFGRPVVLVASNWRDERAVDLDDVAARAFWDVVASTRAEDADADGKDGELGLVLLGRGGTAGFVDGALRAIRGFDLDLEVYLVREVNAAYTLLALAADRIVAHPHGALGAYDAGTCAASVGRLDLETVEAFGGHSVELNVEPEEVPRLAEAAHERKMAGLQLERIVQESDGKHGARLKRGLGRERLGRELALRADELATMGLEARRSDAREGEALWALFRAVEQRFELRGAAPARFDQSGPGEEVQFEPAKAVPSAIIQTAERAFVYEMDTGKPHPDTNVYEGTWVEG